MQNKIIVCFLFSLLTGCDQIATQEQFKEAFSEPSGTQTLIDVPALPVIQSAITQISVKMTENYDPATIQLICSLARSEITKEQAIQLLNRDGVDLSTVQSEGSKYSLLVNNDQKRRQQVCAVWIAANVVKPLTEDEMIEPQKNDVKESENDKKKGENSTEKILNKERVSFSLAVKMSILRTNAEFYSLIASGLGKQKGLSLDMYTQKVSTKFFEYAPLYLKRVQELYLPSTDGYQLLRYDSGNYAFQTSGGYAFSRDGAETLLMYQGINWLGRGEIMGKKYFFPVNYFPSTLTKNKTEGTRQPDSKSLTR